MMDPRAQRVRDALVVSAWDLVQVQSLATLSVAQVCRHAQVSRQVFYKHFSDLDAVVLAAVLDSFDAAVDAWPDPLEAVVDWISEHGQLERNLYPSQVAEKLAQHLREVVRPVCEAVVPASLSAGVARQDVVTMLIGGLVELLREVASATPEPGHGADKLRALLSVVGHGCEAAEPSVGKKQ